MKTIVGIRFKKPGKVYFFDPGDIKLKIDDYVIVDTAAGMDFAIVAIANKEVPDSRLVEPLRKVIRKATKRDIKHNEDNRKKEKDALKVMQEKIKKHKLDMNITGVEYNFDNSKLTFYFTADGRIDFRELVKELASVFKTRIELRQIGVRDEVRRIGGNGVCGRELCCCSFLNKFDSVSIKMAKEQNISLNPSKISGNCGRLKCCLRYEQNVYEEKLSRIPKVGAIVKTNEGEGVVEGIETLKEVIKVKLKDEENEYYFKRYKADDVKIIKNVEENDNDLEDSEDIDELKKMEKLSQTEENM